MAIEQIKMPQLGESVTEGTISSWLVKPGDKVNKYDPLAEVMTDKVNAEVPSSFTGVIKELIAAEGDTIAVGDVICTIEVEGGEASAPEAPAAQTPAVSAAPTPAPAASAAVEQVKMPQLGESVTEGTISSWLVKPGDKVNKYDPLAEVMTDKVNAEVPSSFTGVIKELTAAEGDTIEVGGIICTIEVEGASAPAAAAAPTSAAKAPASAPAAAPQSGGKVNNGRFSPAVLKLAQENNIDLAQVPGTGAGGRVTRKDIQKIIETGNIPAPAAAPTPTAPAKQTASTPAAPKAAPKAAPAPNVPVAAGDIEIPVTGVRKAIAANMLRSKHEAPHAWTMIEVDVTNLVGYRNSIKGEFKKKEGFNLTFFAFFVKAVAQALKEFPMINSMWAGDKIVQKKDINISIAVATEDALFVPVIKNADEKTIKGIAREITDLATKVRTGKLKADEMQGGTITVNNTGSFGSVQSMGIINYPQAAILQVESIVKRPMVVNGMIAVRDMVNLCLSLDHRVLDGLVCGNFLARVKEILESTSKENTSVY